MADALFYLLKLGNSHFIWFRFSFFSVGIFWTVFSRSVVKGSFLIQFSSMVKASWFLFNVSFFEYNAVSIFTASRMLQVRAIGVSNFLVHHIEHLMEDGAKIMPMVNQVSPIK